MKQRKRRDMGLPYIKNMELIIAQFKTSVKLKRYNQTTPYNIFSRTRQLKNLLGRMGRFVYFQTPFTCSQGANISVGENFYACGGCTIMDEARVVIGRNCMFGPNVSIFTSGCPVHPDIRKKHYEYAIPVYIGNNVFVGGGSIINPGVTIGDNVVIGSGSVVTRDIPSGMVAAGNPCKVIREITDEDRQFYYRDRTLDKKLLAKINKKKKRR